MAVEVVLPKVDMDMETGTIAQWRVAEGDVVAVGDVLFEMETSKSLMEVEAPAGGRIRGLAPVDQQALAVGTVVAWIDDVAAQPAAGGVAATAAAAQTAPSSTVSPMGAANAGPASGGSRPAAAPASAQAAATSAPTGSEHPVLPASSREPLRATPLARQRARDEGVTLAEVKGSGPLGRIVAADVDAMARSERVLPMSPTRRTIAERLAQSARNAPHFFLTAHMDMGALRAALAAMRHGEGSRARPHPSTTLAIVHLVARVLSRHPMVNARFGDDGIHLPGRVNVGVAMDREGDLVVPVLRDADRLSLAELADDYARLLHAVRERSITPADMRGGTFTVSNLGMFGVDAFTAIINPPESAILAIGRTLDTPVGRDGAIVLRPMATFCLSSDHRVVDGAAAARFMADLRVAIESPDALSLAPASTPGTALSSAHNEAAASS